MPMALTSGSWTLEQLHALPDDGNKYELVRGQLFVTPLPSVGHEVVLSRLSDLLRPFVKAHDLGLVLHRAGVCLAGSEAEPDLMVRHVDATARSWRAAPMPSLVVEVLSPATRRRDLTAKRDYYLEAGIPEYWIVDRDARMVTVVRRDGADVVVTDTVRWSPTGIAGTLDVRLSDIFGA